MAGICSDEFGFVLGKGNRRSPRCRRPIEQRHIRFRGRADGGLGIGQQSLPKAGVLHFQTAQAVSLGAQVETPGPRPHRLGGGEVLRFHLVGLLLHKGIGILGKSAGRRSQQAQMLAGSPPADFP